MAKIEAEEVEERDPGYVPPLRYSFVGEIIWLTLFGWAVLASKYRQRPAKKMPNKNFPKE